MGREKMTHHEAWGPTARPSPTADYRTGQKVTVYQPDIISGTVGTITCIGRDLVSIRLGVHGRTLPFRIADQRVHGQVSGIGTYFRTDEQEKEANRRNTATTRCAEYGFRLDIGFGNLPVDKLERIADILEEAD